MRLNRIVSIKTQSEKVIWSWVTKLKVFSHGFGMEEKTPPFMFKNKEEMLKW